MKKIKFFNISTKGNETQNQPSKSKRKIFKAFGFGSLAVMMAVAGTFAFAPLCAGAQGGALASASEMVDQINTKADGESIKYAPSALGLDPKNDPVIYTTESGLEIKFGGATAYTANGGGNETATVSYSNLGSGKPLSGYPYFTMGTYSGYAVNWVIIGKSTSISNTTATTYDTLTNWQSKTAQSPTYKKFFDSTYEATTPAGVAIKNNNTLNDYTARKLSTTFPALSSIPANSEIPANCVLVISECTLGTSIFYSTATAAANYEGSTLKSNINTLYNSSLGLTEAQKNTIVARNLTNCYSTKADTSVAVGESSTVNSTSSSQKLFPLACAQGQTFAKATSQSYRIENYLTTNALRQAYQIGTTTLIRYYTRGSVSWSCDPIFINLSGAWASSDKTYSSPTGSTGSSYNTESNTSMAMRPAGVISMA